MDYRKYYAEQIEWYTKQNVFCRGQIEWYTKQLKRSRKEDRELAEYALSTKPADELTLKIFGGKYVSNETKNMLNTRARYYREVKDNEKRIAFYQKRLAELN